MRRGRVDGRTVRALLAAAWLLPFGAAALAEGGVYRHHVGLEGGAGWQRSKTSATIGFEYAYRFKDDNYIGVFYEETFGDFEISATGVLFGRHFGEHLKASIGPAIETKLKTDKDLLLIRARVGYDWHSGHWSYGPLISYDLIEDDTDAIYIGLAVEYGF